MITLEYSPGLRREIEERYPGDWNLENFRRASVQAKLAMLGAIAAVYGSGVDLETLAVYGVDGDGTREENSAYWADYLENGRELGRGSLFVATLASTPAAEAAIAIGAHGGVCYYYTGEVPETRPALVIETTRERVKAWLKR